MGFWDCVAWFWVSAFNYHDFDTRKEYFVGTLVNLVLVFSGLCGFLFLVAAFTESEEILDSVVAIGLIVAFIVYFVPFVSARFRRINDTIFSPFWTFAMFVPGLSIVPFVMTFWVSENVDTELFEDDVDEDIAKPVFEELKLQDVDSSELGVQVLAIYVSAMMDGLVEEYIEIDEDDKAEVLEDLLERYYDVEDVNVEQFVEEIGSHFEKKDVKAVNRIRKKGLAIYEDLKIGVTDDVVPTYKSLIRKAKKQNAATEADGLAGWKHKFWKPDIVKVTAPKASTEVNQDEPRAAIKQETETAESVDELAVKQEADVAELVDETLDDPLKDMHDALNVSGEHPEADYEQDFFSKEKALLEASPIFKRRDEFARDYISLKLVPEANLPLTASKVGGYGYIPKTMEYPNYAGVPMKLVAQFNLDELPNLDGFPDTGILAFYVDQTTEYYGNVENGDVPGPYRVLYFRNTDIAAIAAYTNVEIRQMFREYSDVIEIADDDKIFSELEGEFRISGELKTDYLYNTYLNEFKDAFELDGSQDYLAELFGEDAENVGEYLLNYNFIVNHYVNESKIGGYPDFCFQDPRIGNEKQMLLFQLAADDIAEWHVSNSDRDNDLGVGIVSERKKTKDVNITSAVMNFFIKPEELQCCDFTNVTLHREEYGYDK